MGLWDYSLRFGVKEVRGPAFHEARVPGEPQRHHEEEERQDAAFGVTHGAQALVFVPDHLIRCPLLVRQDRTAAPRFTQAAADGNHNVIGKESNAST